MDSTPLLVIKLHATSAHRTPYALMALRLLLIRDTGGVMSIVLVYTNARIQMLAYLVMNLNVLLDMVETYVNLASNIMVIGIPWMRLIYALSV